ncbi:hypothetical protein [Burkholderia pseudomallei]|uniref:hypothetical protein n=1 Tax=Burkholderia pseudomallei TaxID=28450 RepID=UPI0018AD0127|nr:hypothetical protein [Burkholderia pseudomallei]
MAKGRRRSSAVRRVRPVAVRASPVENATFGDETGGAACADGLAGMSCSIVGRRLRRACRVRRQSPAAVFSGLSARDAWPAMRTRAHGAACSRPAGAASSVRGGSRDAGVAGARGIRAMLERRAPSAGSASAQAADRPAAFDETNGVPCFGGAAGKLAGVSPRAGRRCPLALFEHAFFIGSLT